MLALATAVLLVGPTVLAFRAGGFFEEPRLVAAIVAWAVVLVAALSSSRPLPRSRAGWTALAGLVLMCAWTALSLTWAPLSDAATDNLVRLLLYAGALLAAIALLRESGARRAVEPVLALGTLVVLGYGLAGRLLPTLIEVEESARAADRLDQPITYWNAEGALAAMGLVLCARLTGDRSRPTAIRALAAAACAPLGMGLYLTYSRGAIVAAIVGLVVLVATAPSRSQLRGLGIALAAALVAASCSAALPGVASLEGTRADRETEGAVALALMLAVMLGAALLCARTVAAERQGRIPIATLRFARRLPAIAVAVAGLGLAGVVAGEAAISRRSARRAPGSPR
jgi:hypothetical protein